MFQNLVLWSSFCYAKFASIYYFRLLALIIQTKYTGTSFFGIKEFDGELTLLFILISDFSTSLWYCFSSFGDLTLFPWTSSQIFHMFSAPLHCLPKKSWWSTKISKYRFKLERLGRDHVFLFIFCKDNHIKLNLTSK